MRPRSGNCSYSETWRPLDRPQVGLRVGPTLTRLIYFCALDSRSRSLLAAPANTRFRPFVTPCVVVTYHTSEKEKNATNHIAYFALSRRQGNGRHHPPPPPADVSHLEAGAHSAFVSECIELFLLTVGFRSRPCSTSNDQRREVASESCVRLTTFGLFWWEGGEKDPRPSFSTRVVPELNMVVRSGIGNRHGSCRHVNFLFQRERWRDFPLRCTGAAVIAASRIRI